METRSFFKARNRTLSQLSLNGKKSPTPTPRSADASRGRGLRGHVPASWFCPEALCWRPPGRGMEAPASSERQPHSEHSERSGGSLRRPRLRPPRKARGQRTHVHGEVPGGAGDVAGGRQRLRDVLQSEAGGADGHGQPDHEVPLGALECPAVPGVDVRLGKRQAPALSGRTGSASPGHRQRGRGLPPAQPPRAESTRAAQRGCP